MTDRFDWRLERRALGEAGDADSGAVSSDDRAALEAIRASNQAILERYPPAGVRLEVERRLREAGAQGRRREAGARGRRRSWPAILVPALGTIAVGAGVMVLSGPNDGGEVTRTKGDVRLTVHRKTDGRVEQVRAGDTLAAGDLLQFGYTSGALGQGLVFSVDGRGTFSIHWPESRMGWSASLEPQGASLPSAYELDDAPLFERFFVVVCPERFWVPAMIERITRLLDGETMTVKLNLGGGCQVSDILFLKRER